MSKERFWREKKILRMFQTALMMISLSVVYLLIFNLLNYNIMTYYTFRIVYYSTVKYIV